MRNILAKYNEIELLVRMGEYQRGADPAADEALNKIDAVNELLCQDLEQEFPLQHTVSSMHSIVSN